MGICSAVPMLQHGSWYGQVHTLLTPIHKYLSRLLEYRILHVAVCVYLIFQSTFVMHSIIQGVYQRSQVFVGTGGFVTPKLKSQRLPAGYLQINSLGGRTYNWPIVSAKCTARKVKGLSDADRKRKPKLKPCGSKRNSKIPTYCGSDDGW